MASATTDFPLPSTQLTAAGFLSVQKLPDKLTISMSGNTSSILLMANSVALLSMFINRMHLRTWQQTLCTTFYQQPVHEVSEGE